MRARDAAGGRRGSGAARRARRGREACALAAAALLPVAVLLAAWAAGGPGYDLLVDDNAIYFLPLIHAGQERLWSGDVPFWKHTSLMGAPLLADGQPGVFYPPYWAAWWATRAAGAPARLIDVVAWLHAALGGAGMFLLARRLGAGRAGSVAIATAWGANGFFWVTARGWIVLAATTAWLPLLAWAAWRAGRPPAGRAAGRVAAAALLWAVHGYAGYPQTALMNGGVMVAVAALAGAGRGGGAGGAARGAGRALAAVAAGGALVAPLWLPMQELATRSIRAAGSLSADNVLGLSLPPDRLLGSWWPWREVDNNFVMTYGNAGALAGVLSLVGLAAGARRRPAWWWGGVAGLAAAVPLTVGSHLPATAWVFSLPLMNLFRWPFKNAYLFHFALLFLAVGGWRAAARRLRGAPGGAAARWAVVAAGAMAMAAVPLGARDYAAWRPRPDGPGPLVGALRGPDRVFLTTDSRLARYLPPAETWSYALADHGAAPPSANGYSPIILRAYADLVGVDMFGFVRPSQRAATLALVAEGAFLELLGVGVAFADLDDAPMNEALAAAGWQRLEEATRTVAWRAPRPPMARVRLAERVENLADPAGVLERVRTPSAALRTTAFVAVEGEVRAGPGEVLGWREVADGYDAEVRVDGAAAYLVVAATWDPGWRATSNGARLFVDPANHALIGLELEGAGLHRVELRYEPPRWTLGRLAAGVALVLLGWGVARERAARRPRRRSTDPVEAQ